MTKRELKSMGYKVCRAGYRDLCGERVDGIEVFEEKARAIYNAGEGWQIAAEKQRKNAMALGDYIASKIKK